MKLFKTVSMSTWDIGIIKASIVAMALSVGALWPEIFAPYAVVLFWIGFLIACYALYSWVTK